ncbi:O-antigen ligase [Endozoicomonas sp. OPT23]|uniref:O-antigen ligase family protein n=1 Tax=Endozoicomonas sp. OPT23 TaxID=2072845 RepID=UPI001891B6FD|nr:O-antigen ligase family protein [Endozoicomonas sp. OPT23]
MKKALDTAIVVISIAAIITLYFNFEKYGFSWKYRSFRLESMLYGEYGQFSTSIQAGLFYGAFTVLSFSRMISIKGNSKYIFLVAFLLCLAATYYTGTRLALLGVIIGSVVFLIASSPKLIRPISLFTALGIALFIWEATDLSASTISLEATDQILASITSNRWFIWENALSAVLATSPLVGFGADAEMSIFNPIINFTAHHPHSGFVLIIYESGLIGVSLYLLAMSLLIIKFFSTPKTPLLLAGLALLSFNFVGMASDVHIIVYRPHAYYVFLWLPVGLLLASIRQQNIKESLEEEQSLHV